VCKILFPKVVSIAINCNAKTIANEANKNLLFKGILKIIEINIL